MLKLSPSALQAYLRCKREWWLSYRARAPRNVPAYVTAGSRIDKLVDEYLATPAGGNGMPPPDKELAALLPLLPHPGTVRPQHELRCECPGLPQVELYAKADWVGPVNEDEMLVGDLKRRSRVEDCHTAESLPGDVQAQLEAWIVWRLYNPRRVRWEWTYLPRTNKPWVVNVMANRVRVEAWFDAVVLPAVYGMLEITGPVEAIEHAPEACEGGSRCFVAASCPIYKGPLKGEQLVDLSKFRTNKVAAQAVVESVSASLDAVFTEVLNTSVSQDRLPAINPPPPDSSEALTVSVIEGPGAALLQVEISPTLPSPAADLAPVRRRRKKDTEPCPPPDEPVPYVPVSADERALSVLERIATALEALAAK